MECKKNEIGYRLRDLGKRREISASCSLALRTGFLCIEGAFCENLQSLERCAELTKTREILQKLPVKLWGNPLLPYDRHGRAAQGNDA